MKTETKHTHTPGPWEAEIKQGINVKIYALGTCDGGEHIADVNHSRKSTMENMANARLIAAAPDLLEAAKNARNVLAALVAGDLKKLKVDSPALQMLRIAISKAEEK